MIDCSAGGRIDVRSRLNGRERCAFRTRSRLKSSSPDVESNESKSGASWCRSPPCSFFASPRVVLKVTEYGPDGVDCDTLTLPVSAVIDCNAFCTLFVPVAGAPKLIRSESSPGSCWPLLLSSYQSVNLPAFACTSEI